MHKLGLVGGLAMVRWETIGQMHLRMPLQSWLASGWCYHNSCAGQGYTTTNYIVTIAIQYSAENDQRNQLVSRKPYPQA